MTPNKLPPLPDELRVAIGLLAGLERKHHGSNDAIDIVIEALRQSQSLPAGAVDALRQIAAMCPATCEMTNEHAMAQIATDALDALQADAREKGGAVPQRLLTELYGLAHGDLPDGDGVSVSVAMWANNWLYELTQPAQASDQCGSCGGEIVTACVHCGEPAQASEATLAKAVDNWLNWFRRGDKKDALEAYGKLASAYATYIATSSQETAK